MMARGRRWNRKGQGTLEYLLILATVIAAVAVAAGTIIRPAVDQTMTSSQTAIQNAATQFEARLQ